MYFIKTYSNNYKNSLHKGISEALKPINHMLVADPEKFLIHVQKKVAELNAQNPRCTQARIDHYFKQIGVDETKQIYIIAGDWTYTITLYNVTGELDV